MDRPTADSAGVRQPRLVVDSRVHDVGAAEAAIAAMFTDPRVVELHSRNIAWGCFKFVVRRLPSSDLG